MIAFLAPWEFSPAVLVLCAGALILYSRGVRRAGNGEKPAMARRVAFFTGILAVYFVMQTRFDYLSQHMFFIHRLQHLVLHHVGPFLIVLSQPLATLGGGLPAWLDAGSLRRFWHLPATRFAYGLLQNAVVAPVLFVGLIAFWLTSRIHFDAMLSAPLYWTMNWSMLIDGLLFWALMLDPRTQRDGALLAFGPRIFIVLAAMVPQLLIGAYLTFADHDLYDVYAVCGRAWAVDPLTDQRVGGLITWIPPAMMHAVAALILIGWWMHSDSDAARLPSAPSSSPAP